MFFSLMAIIHKEFPIATNYFRLKKEFINEYNANNRGHPVSIPFKTFAGPNLIPGL